MKLHSDPRQGEIPNSFVTKLIMFVAAYPFGSNYFSLRSSGTLIGHDMTRTGDRIKSIKIEFTGTPLQDAVAILSLASPYPVEIEVVDGARVSGGGRRVVHPVLLRRAGSTGDVSTLEKEGKLWLPPKSPSTSHSNNSTLENKSGKGGIKKIITEKIITTTTLERKKKEKKDGQPTTLEKENEKNDNLAHKARHSDLAAALNKPERIRNRHSRGMDVHVIQSENGLSRGINNSKAQKHENEPKRGMAFGIRVLPPNIPDDGVLKQRNTEDGVVSTEKKTRDRIEIPEPPRIAPIPQVRHETETEIKKPVVAKRRDKIAPPIPNARVKVNEDPNTSHDSSNTSESSFTTFARNEFNSSGIQRDENSIPLELPQQMLEAANAARSNRKSYDLTFEKGKSDKQDCKRDEVPKSKKSKGKAPSPPAEKNRTENILEQLRDVKDFLKHENMHSSLLHETSFTSGIFTPSTFSTSTQVEKPKNVTRIDDSINFSEDDIDDIVSRPFRKESDSLNNYFEDSKSKMSPNQDVCSLVSFTHSDKSDKRSTTIELNNSDITIHSSPNETMHSTSHNASALDENERKAASLCDLYRFEFRAKNGKLATGTLERAQSLDITAEDAEIKESTLSLKKRKAMSVVETMFFDYGAEDGLPDMIDSNKGIKMKSKEPRLALAKTSSAMEGHNTFQSNHLKKASEFGNLEDAILKGSNSSIESEKVESHVLPKWKFEKDLEYRERYDSLDNLPRRIMDENMKIHMKLAQESAKSTQDGSNMSSLDSTQQIPPTSFRNISPIKYEEKLTMAYDTNMPDDLKVSRNTYANSLERPKSEMMKKLLAKNPTLNVHLDQNTQNSEASSSNEPDIVNINFKSSQFQPKDYDDDYVSSIRVGSKHSSLQQNKKPFLETFTSGWSEKDKYSHNKNIVTISTNEKPEPANESGVSYTKSIGIGETLIPDMIEGIQRQSDEREGRTRYMERRNVFLTMSQAPVLKTVTVNVAEDDYGNKVITQNVEKVSTNYLRSKSEAPLEVEQISFGIMKNSGHIDAAKLEEGEVKEIDKKILDKIRQKNPNIHFTTEEPAFTRTETIILNTNLDEEHAKELMEKIKNDSNFMANTSPSELSQMGSKIIHDLEDIQNKSHDTVEEVKTGNSINPAAVETQKDHTTEIQVVTPHQQKMVKPKSDFSRDTVEQRHTQRFPQFEEPPLSYELDIDLLNDFIANERHYSAKQLRDSQKRAEWTQIDNEPKKRHSDFDLPRNSHIKFRTATYEPSKATLVTSTDIENRRLSQMDQMQLRTPSEVVPPKPALPTKHRSIPVKIGEKPKQATDTTGVVSLKIPVFTNQKPQSYESLAEKNFVLPRSPPPPPSGGNTANISVTAIKSSCRSPSGCQL